jgi:hypothetical protein
MEMTGIDAREHLAGYWPSAWPAECGGPRRQKVARSPGLSLQPGERLAATTLQYPGRWAVMFVQRDPGQLYLQGGTPPNASDSFGWVEQLDPESLRPLRSSPHLPSGGHNWCGAATVHANGDIYVVNGRYVHRLSPDLAVVAELKLRTDNAHNGHLIVSDGNMVTKDIQADPAKRSVFTVFDADLRVVDEYELPWSSVGRFSSDRVAGEDHLYVTSPRAVHRLVYREGRLQLDADWTASYEIPGQDQSWAWDSCLGDDSLFLMDMGANGPISAILGSSPIGTAQSIRTMMLPKLVRLGPVVYRISSKLGQGERLGGLRLGGKPSHTAPQHVFRFSLADPAERDVLTPFAVPGGNIYAPPLYDPTRRVLVAFDSANRGLVAWRYIEPGVFVELWRKPKMLNTSQLTVYADSGELLVDDVVAPTARWDAVVLDIESGHERGRVDTGLGMSGGMWYTPGFERDFYTSSSFGGIARIHVA